MCHDDTWWTTSCLGVGAPRAEESLVDPLSRYGFAVRKHMGMPAGVRELGVPRSWPTVVRSRSLSSIIVAASVGGRTVEAGL